MNPLMNLIGGGTAQNGTSSARQIIAKMIAAAATGQTPEQFMTNLSQENPAFKGMDFSNLESTAEKLCGKKNININDAVSKVKDGIGKLKW
jgi:hypothetical protein